MDSNISNGFLTAVSDRCMSENQQHLLFVLLISNILLLVVLMDLPQKLNRALHREKPPVGGEDNSISPGKKTKDSAIHKKNQWYCVGASVMGTSHESVGLPCQDRHRVHYLPSGALIIAVADGVGSVLHPDKGARIACDAAVDHIAVCLKDTCSLSDKELADVLRNAYQCAVGRIQEQAEKEQVHVREFATTLTVAVITDGLIAGATVGDGMMVVEDVRGEFSCFFSLPKREYANEVVSITSAQWPAELQIASRFTPVKTVSLFTDGLLRLSCDVRKNIPHAPFFQMMTSLLYTVTEQKQAIEELQVLLNHPWINDRTDDDKTFVMAANIGLDAGEEGRSDNL